MRRIVSLAMTFLLVFSFVAVLQVPSIAAQETGALGTPVLITDAAGEPLIEMSVDSFTPDFTGYDNSYAPDRGFVYGLATITVTNVGTSPYALNTYSFMLIDTDGFMSQAAFAMVDTAQAPDAFDYDAIEPGDSVTGSVLFSMLAGTSAAAIGYSTTYDRVSLLASDIAFPAVGDTANILNQNAESIASVTFEEWLDPLPGVDSSMQPNRGYHYAGAVVTIENTGSQIFTVDPWSFKLYDVDGYQNSGSSAYRNDPEVPDLGYVDLASGELTTGIVSFEVFNTSAPAFIVVQTDSQYAFIAGFDDAPEAPALSDLPTVDAVYDGSAAADDSGTSTGGDDQAAVDASPECIEVNDWLQAMFADLDENEIVGNFDITDAPDMTVDELTAVRDEFENIRDDYESMDVPELAEDFFGEFLGVLDYMIDGIDEVIDAMENGDDVQALVDELEADEAPMNGYFEAAVALGEACPNLGF